MNKVKLGHLVELKYGKGLRKDKRAPGQYPVFGSNGIVDYHNQAFVNGPTIIVGRKGSIGETHIIHEPCWPIDTTYYVASTGNEEFDLEWLYLVLKSLRLQSLNRAAAVPGLNREDVYNIEIHFPNFEDQRRIAHLLGKVEGLITQRKQHLQQLDDLLKSVFLDMFGDPVRNEKGWDKPPLKAFGKISTGNTPPRKDPSNYDSEFIEWIKTDNIPKDAMNITYAVEHLSESGSLKARTVKKGAILVACIAGSIESIGRAALTNRLVAFNQQINAIQPTKYVNSLYLYSLFKLSRTYIQSHATKGMKKILTKGDFEQITMIKPPIELQDQFATIAEKVETLKCSYQQCLNDLELLYGALSQQAFNGELDLWRVALPDEKEKLKANENEKPKADEIAPENIEISPLSDFFQIPADTVAMEVQTEKGRKAFFKAMLIAWREQFSHKTFSLSDFLDTAQNQLWKLTDGESNIGLEDYERIKNWLFEELAEGKLTQSYDENNNLLQIAAVSPKGKLA